MKKQCKVLQEFNSYRQSMDWGSVHANNNDSDMSEIMENGFCNANPYLMYSDSDISKPVMIQAQNRKAQIVIEENGLDSSVTVSSLRKSGEHHAGMPKMFKEASRMAYERMKSNTFVPIF